MGVLISSNLPFSLGALFVDVAITPTEVSNFRYDRIVGELRQGVRYEVLCLRLSNLSPLTDGGGELCLLPSNKFLAELSE